MAAGLVLACMVACGGGGSGNGDDGAGGGGGGGTDSQTPSAPSQAQNDLASPANKDVAMQLVSSAENSTLDWRAQYGYIEDIGDGRGYTGGIIGFTSGTGDMLGLVQAYTNQVPGNALAAFLPALRAVNGTASHQGLGDPYISAWKAAARTAAFRDAQDSERDRGYFNPSVSLAKLDGLGVLGQFIYYDAAVVHGLGKGSLTLEGIRAAALKKAAAPAQGGDEVAYLNAFLDARVVVMKSEAAHSDVSRIETAQRVFLQLGNLSLTPPLSWKVYGDSYSIAAPGTPP
jgi:chitosanase